MTKEEQESAMEDLILAKISTAITGLHYLYKGDVKRVEDSVMSYLKRVGDESFLNPKGRYVGFLIKEDEKSIGCVVDMVSGTTQDLMLIVETIVSHLSDNDIEKASSTIH